LSNALRTARQARRHAATTNSRALIRLGALGLSNVGAIVEVDTYYDILGVPPGADNREIKAAFRKLAKLSHPDFNAGDEEAERRFKKIDRAYKVLCDSAMRAAYDLHLEQLRSLLERERSDRAAGQRDRQQAGVAAPRHFWREAGGIAASAGMLTVCFIALAVAWGQMSATSRSPGSAVTPSARDNGGGLADLAAAAGPTGSAAVALTAHRSATTAPDTLVAEKAATGPPSPPSPSRGRAHKIRLADAATMRLQEVPRAAPKQPGPEWLSLGEPQGSGDRLEDRQDERSAVPRPKSGLPDEVPQRPAPVPSSEASPDDIAQAVRLVGQGERYRANGNIAVAREYFARAADLGLAAAALKMAETHDPRELSAANLYGPKANPAEARKWYERAMALGAREAEARLRRLDGH
jgi:DnaJ-domain-containing protein 1